MTTAKQPKRLHPPHPPHHPHPPHPTSSSISFNSLIDSYQQQCNLICRAVGLIGVGVIGELVGSGWDGCGWGEKLGGKCGYREILGVQQLEQTSKKYPTPKPSPIPPRNHNPTHSPSHSTLLHRLTHKISKLQISFDDLQKQWIEQPNNQRLLYAHENDNENQNHMENQQILARELSFVEQANFRRIQARENVEMGDSGMGIEMGMGEQDSQRVYGSQRKYYKTQQQDNPHTTRTSRKPHSTSIPNPHPHLHPHPKPSPLTITHLACKNTPLLLAPKKERKFRKLHKIKDSDCYMRSTEGNCVENCEERSQGSSGFWEAKSGLGGVRGMRGVREV